MLADAERLLKTEVANGHTSKVEDDFLNCFSFVRIFHTSENRKNVSGRKERIVFKTASVIMLRSH